MDRRCLYICWLYYIFLNFLSLMEATIMIYRPSGSAVGNEEKKKPKMHKESLHYTLSTLSSLFYKIWKDVEFYSVNKTNSQFIWQGQIHCPGTAKKYENNQYQKHVCNTRLKGSALEMKWLHTDHYITLQYIPGIIKLVHFARAHHKAVMTFDNWIQF